VFIRDSTQAFAGESRLTKRAGRRCATCSACASIYLREVYEEVEETQSSKTVDPSTRDARSACGMSSALDPIVDDVKEPCRSPCRRILLDWRATSRVKFFAITVTISLQLIHSLFANRTPKEQHTTSRNGHYSSSDTATDMSAHRLSRVASVAAVALGAFRSHHRFLPSGSPQLHVNLAFQAGTPA